MTVSRAVTNSKILSGKTVISQVLSHVFSGAGDVTQVNKSQETLAQCVGGGGGAGRRPGGAWRDSGKTGLGTRKSHSEPSLATNSCMTLSEPFNIQVSVSTPEKWWWWGYKDGI